MSSTLRIALLWFLDSTFEPENFQRLCIEMWWLYHFLQIPGNHLCIAYMFPKDLMPWCICLCLPWLVSWGVMLCSKVYWICVNVERSKPDQGPGPFSSKNRILLALAFSWLQKIVCSRNWKVADMNWKWLKANWKISNLSNRPWVIFNSYQGIIIISDDYNSARRFVTAYGRIAHRGSLMWVRFELDLGGVMIINGDLKWFLNDSWLFRWYKMIKMNLLRAISN